MNKNDHLIWSNDPATRKRSGEEHEKTLGSIREDEFKLSTRYTPVFNASEVEGMPALPAPEETPGIGMDVLVSRLSVGMGVPIYLDGGDKAYYSPHKDEIHLPTPGSFKNNYAFNATALHELSHSTGHPSRLNRPQSDFFGTSQYAYEELVAEMCSCFMGYGLEAEASSEHLDNHKAYVQSWIQAIREKPETLIKAIRDAQGAASYMDWKAGLISEKEYKAEKAHSFEVKVRDIRSRDTAR